MLYTSENLGNLEKCAFFSRMSFDNSPMSANFEFCDVFENFGEVMFACLVALLCRVLVSLVFAFYSSDLLGRCSFVGV